MLSEQAGEENGDATAPTVPQALGQMPVPPPVSSSCFRTELTLGGLTFGSDFDSGNLGRVEQKADTDEFVMWTRADCEGTPHATKSRTWFCFYVRGAVPGQELKFEVKMTPQVKLYEHGMRPVFRALPSQPEWTRLPRSTPCNGLRHLDGFSSVRHL